MEPAVGEEENVRVVVRARPLSEKEKKADSEHIIKVDKLNRSITVQKINTPQKTFTFDQVYDENTTQLEIYSESVSPIVDKVIEGYNGTIIAYGQTGTGKTYTMSGYEKDSEKGVIPNTFAHMFGHIAKSHDDKKFLVCVSYLEIYNEEIRDLITNSGNLELREKSSVGVFVPGLTGYMCKNADEINTIMELGNSHRTIGSTNMNEASSRSHAILTITFETASKHGDQKITTQGKLSLVDLAGSERQNKTNATGLRLKESAQINLSLSVLGNVISALVDGKSTHIPYRNSKLTRLLQDSLGGNSKTVMIATVGPADSNYDETISTLRYANRAKNIQNFTKINEQPEDTFLEACEKEINDLRKQLDEVVPQHIVIEEEEEEEEEDNNGETAETVNDDVDLPQESKKIEELNKTIDEQSQLQAKLARLEEKILVGGENLLEKAQNQELLLEEAKKELDNRRMREAEMMKTIKQVEAERLDIEEKYNSLSEELEAKNKKTHQLQSILKEANTELLDLKQECSRELEASLENIRTIQRELMLSNMLIKEHIPQAYFDKIKSCSQWNEDIGEWQLKCVAYTGNHLRRHKEAVQTYEAPVGLDCQRDSNYSSIYLKYPSYRKEIKKSHVPRLKN